MVGVRRFHGARFARKSLRNRDIEPGETSWAGYEGSWNPDAHLVHAGFDVCGDVSAHSIHPCDGTLPSRESRAVFRFDLDAGLGERGLGAAEGENEVLAHDGGSGC